MYQLRYSFVLFQTWQRRINSAINTSNLINYIVFLFWTHKGENENEWTLLDTNIVLVWRWRWRVPKDCRNFENGKKTKIWRTSSPSPFAERDDISTAAFGVLLLYVTFNSDFACGKGMILHNLVVTPRFQIQGNIVHDFYRSSLHRPWRRVDTKIIRSRLAL